MAADSNRGFDQEKGLGSAMNRSRISFHSGAVVNSSSEMIGMGSYYGVSNSTGNLGFLGNSGMIGVNNDPSGAQAGNSSASLLLDSVNGVNHDAEHGVEWSAEEQLVLEESLIKYADEPPIMRYVKIAATLGEKTVRDVALRCRWMMRKRPKHEESHLGRKGNYRKEKLVEPSSKMNLSSPSTPKIGVHPFSMHQMDRNERIPSSKMNLSSPSTPKIGVHPFSMHQMDRNERIKWEVICRRARQILEQNMQVFGEIHQNLSSFKLQDNIALLYRTRENINNLSAIMKEIPGRMSQMQQLPVSIDQDLADSILPHTTQMAMLNMSRRAPPKQDLGYDGSLPV